MNTTHSGREWPDETHHPKTELHGKSERNNVPRVYTPRISHEEGRNAKRKTGILSGLFAGHNRVDSEEANRIYISTDIMMDRQNAEQSDGGSGKSEGQDDGWR